jgi:hypothetical protein
VTTALRCVAVTAVVGALAGCGGDKPEAVSDEVAVRQTMDGFVRLFARKPRAACERYLTDSARRQLTTKVGPGCEVEEIANPIDKYSVRVRIIRPGREALAYYRITQDSVATTFCWRGSAPKRMDLVKSGDEWRIARFRCPSRLLPPPGGFVCTKMGCGSGVSLDTSGVRKRWPEAKRIRFCVEKRCQTQPSVIGYYIVHHTIRISRVRTVRVMLQVLDRDGRTLATRSTASTLRAGSPNGPNCGPTCYGAGFDVDARGRLVPHEEPVAPPSD